MNNKTVTAEDVLKLEPCVSDEVIRAAFHAGPATLLDILEWTQFTESHRVWAVCQLLDSAPRKQFAEGCAERVIRAVYKNASAEWKNWADAWLSGKNRTAEAAEAAARAAWAAARAARAAWAAAEAARAAWAAAEAARAAWAAAEAAWAAARAARAAWAAAEAARAAWAAAEAAAEAAEVAQQIEDLKILLQK